MQYADRREAGRALAEKLVHYAGRDDVVVLALPRGGVPVAHEVATVLHAPLDVFIVRKLGYPGHEEYAMGAIASGGVVVMNADIGVPVSDAAMQAAIAREQEELRRREQLYRGSRAMPELEGRTVILVDDGLATGSTMRAAVQAVKKSKPARVVVAVPVAARDSCEAFRREVDEVVCAMTPEPFRAVGLWYRDFEQTSDEEVHRLLAQPVASP